MIGPPARAATGDRAGHERIAYLDSIKLLLVAAIIAGHGALAYGDLESAWPYQDIQEVRLSEAGNTILAAITVPAVLFTMGLFFLISGLVTPGSVARKGPGRFARDRIVRLGGPLLVWTLALWPGAIWLAHLAAGDNESFWSELGDDEPVLDTGPMWFVAVLLAYSLAYAAWRSTARGAGVPGTAPRPTPIPGRTLIGLAAAISLGTVLVRLVFPIASPQVGQSHLWQWPQFVVMFGLGVVAARRGGLSPVPDRIRHGAGLAALAGIVAFGLLGLAMAATGTDGEVLFDEPGLHWAPLVLAAIEGPIAIGASVWLLAVAQRRLADEPGPFRRSMARSAYAAFLLQGVVLIGLMVALRPFDAPAEVKAVTVAALGVAGSFALAWALVTRTALGRIL